MLLRYLKNKKESQKVLGNKVTIVAWKELMSVVKTKRFNQEGADHARLGDQDSNLINDPYMPDIEKKFTGNWYRSLVAQNTVTKQYNWGRGKTIPNFTIEIDRGGFDVIYHIHSPIDGH